MATIKYKDEDGNWKVIATNKQINGKVTEISVDDKEPIDPNIKVWYNTSGPTPSVSCNIPGVGWTPVGGGEGEIEYLTSEDFELIMMEVGI